MKDSELNRVETIFHAALELPPRERTAYLVSVCSGDHNLYNEVDSLIKAHEDDGFMDEPAFDLGMKVMGYQSNGSMAGKYIGVYRIIEALGKGGMGDVYLAEDTRLGRKVALKFLSSAFVGDNWAKRQLIKEAQAVAMLDHPNICPVYGMEEQGELSYIVMQYIEGKPLSELIRSKSISPQDVLPLATQIVRALAEAHAHGIIHRDIKPGNIVVTPSGQAKVLDFGLAKTVQKPTATSVAESISQLSQAGILVGTVSYMSPEQLRGEKLDYRSDIFSLGAVLYEIASGKNPHAHETNAEIISSILLQRPQPLKQTGLPAGLNQVIEKCLEKEKNRRYQSAADLSLDLALVEKRSARGRTLHPIPFFRIAAALIFGLLLVLISTWAYGHLTRPLSVAVLPIENASGDAGLDYLSHGLTASLIDRLSGLSRLRTKPLSVVSGYKGSDVDLRKVGQDLKVEALLIGRIIGHKDSSRLQVNLVSADDGLPLWTEEYELGLSNIFTVEQQISEAVTSKLELWSRKDTDRIRTARLTEDPEAFRQYMLGKYYWTNRNSENIKKAIDSFNAAIKIDPVYAKAWAGLADCYALMNTTAYGDMRTDEAMNKARVAATRALELDNTLAEAHTSLGVVSLKYDWNWREAENSFKRALRLNPDYYPAHYWYSVLLTITGRQAEALNESELARNLDPFSASTRVNFCREFYYFRQFNTAVDCLGNILKDDPANVAAKHILGFVVLQQGRNDEALKLFADLPEGNTDNQLYKLISRGFAYGKAGRKEEALAILKEVEEIAKRSYVPPHELAVLYLGLEDNDHTFYWLNKACDEHFASLIYLTVDPAFDSLRSDSRFAELASRMNLPLLQ